MCSKNRVYIKYTYYQSLLDFGGEPMLIFIWRKTQKSDKNSNNNTIIIPTGFLARIIFL